MKTAIPTRTKIYGLDYLRAIACIFVVAFHASPILMDFWYARAIHVFIFASAVPIFIVISLFLTELKGSGRGYLINKSYRIGKIYLLWGWILPGIIFLLTQLIGSNKIDYTILKSNYSIYGLILNGVDWPFKVYGIYFLVFLVCLSWIHHLLKPLMRSYSQIIILSLGLALINLILPWLPASYQVVRESFLPFLIYIPLAQLLHFDYQKNLDWWQRSLKFGALYLIMTIFEAGAIAFSNKLEILNYHYSPYGRLSIVFLSMCLIYASLNLSQQFHGRSRLVDLISYASLGIYLTHGFIMGYIQNMDFALSPLLFFLSVFSLALVSSVAIKDIPYIRQILTL